MTPWRAQPGPQLRAVQADTVDELFYGGAVFGGKSDFLLGDFAQDVPRWYGAHWHGILFRKSYPELEDLISRSQEIYPSWFPGVDWLKADKTWVWPNGATLKMRFMESVTDWMLYWGHAYTWIGFDELPLWPTMEPYLKLKARMRSAKVAIPNKRIRSTGNPGGPGHGAVKQYFRIDQHPNGGVVFDAPDGSGMRRLYVKSRLSDNKIGMANDPGYEQRLDGTGSPQFVRAIKDGDWSVIEGAYFPEFNSLVHVRKPFAIPSHWTRFKAGDWGSAKPFSIGWYAVSAGDVPGVARGALVKYREWYGIKINANGEFEADTGLKMTAEEVAKGINDRESTNECDYGVLDPSAFAENGGPSIAHRMAAAPYFVQFRPADNRRVGGVGAMVGWDQLRARLVGTCQRDAANNVDWSTGDPMLVIFDTCVHTIRTIPSLQHDKIRPEDVDTDCEDHAADETRYACMSRPYGKPIPKPQEPPRGARTIEEMVRRHEALMGDTRRI